MKVILTNKIQKKEFPKGISENEKKVILDNAKKELALEIKGKNLPKSTSLLKVYATSDKGVRRIVYLLQNKLGDFILLFYRSKNDKLGQNITIKNPLFEAELSKAIDKVIKDLDNDAFIILEK